MSLVFQKYVIGLGWRVTCLPDGSAAVAAPGPGSERATFEPALACLESLVVQLEVRAPQTQSCRLGTARRMSCTVATLARVACII